MSKPFILKTAPSVWSVVVRVGRRLRLIKTFRTQEEAESSLSK